MTGRRFFNLTTISASAAPSITQVWVDNFASAMVELQSRVLRKCAAEDVLIAAYICDTATRELRAFKIVSGVVSEVAL